MPCVCMKGRGKYPRAILCLGGTIYEFEGWLFEVHSHFGPMLLHRQTLSPRVNQPKAFWEAMERWEKRSDDEKAKAIKEK